MDFSIVLVIVANILVVIGIGLRIIRRMRQAYQLRHQLIVPCYEPPKGLAPAQLSILDSPGASQNDITATLVDLINRSVMKLELLKPKAGWQSADYRLTLLQPTNTLPNFEKTLLAGIFQGKKMTTLYDAAANYPTYAYQVNEFRHLVGNSIRSKGYSDTLMTTRSYWIVAVCLWAAVGYFSLMAITMITGPNAAYTPIVAVIDLICALVYAWLSWLPSGRTKKGMKLWADIQGFKQYLQVAEHERLDFHLPPLKTPEHFDALLPYAIALGLEIQWAKHFDGVFLTPNLVDWQKESAKYDNANAKLLGSMTSDIRKAFQPDART